MSTCDFTMSQISHAECSTALPFHRRRGACPCSSRRRTAAAPRDTPARPSPGSAGTYAASTARRSSRGEKNIAKHNPGNALQIRSARTGNKVHLTAYKTFLPCLVQLFPTSRMAPFSDRILHAPLISLKREKRNMSGEGTFLLGRAYRVALLVSS